jgi:antitoxin component HigA of HigAB toxin-antitoxin module
MNQIDATLSTLRWQISEAIADASQATLEPSAATVQDILREHRQNLGLSLDDVAKAAGLSKGHVWDMERRNAKNYTVDTIHRLAIALGIPFLVLCAAALRSIRRE